MQTSEIPLRLPAVLVRAWSDPPQSLPEAEADALGSLDGVHRLGPGLFAVLPVAGDAGGIEVAVGCGRRLLAALESDLAARGAEARLGVLVLPADLRIEPGASRPVAEALLDDLDARPPDVPSTGLYATGHAARRGEGLLEFAPCGSYEGRSGSLVPLFQLRGLRREPVPWGNAQILGAAPAYVPRRELEAELTEHASGPVLRVAGPLGCGKTRTLWQVLGPGRKPQPDAVPLWAVAHPPRSGLPDLAGQVLRRLVRLASLGGDLAGGIEALGLGEHAAWLLADPLEVSRSVDLDPPAAGSLDEAVVAALVSAADLLRGPLRLVADDLHAARPEDLTLLARLAAEPRLAGRLHLVLAGRPAAPWQAPFAEAPAVEVPPMGEEELTRLGEGLLGDLKMPQAVQERLLEASGGFPLALEEGLARMIQRKQLRRIYGNFFFSGDSETGYEPSRRLIQHLEAEIGRLGDATPLRLLALAGTAVPAQELAAAASLLGREITPHWEVPFVEAGCLERVPSPWGDGVAFRCPAFRDAVGRTVVTEWAPEARRALGELLSLAGDQPEARWYAYELLSGSTEAVSPILELARGAGAGALPQERVLEALTRELEAHRSRGGDEATELRLLWILLPLAKRLDRLSAMASEIARALELSAEEPRKYLAFASIQTELDMKQGRLEKGEKNLRRALELVLEDDPQRQALVLLQLGRLLVMQERLDEARSLFEALLAGLEKRGAAPLAASCRFHLGNVALKQDRLEEALGLHGGALESHRERGQQRGAGMAWSALGAVHLALGDYPKSLACCRKAEEILAEHGENGDVSSALVGIGRVLDRLGDHTGASPPLRRALALREGESDVVGEAIARLAVASNQLSLHRLEDAMAQARQAHFRLSLVPESALLGSVERILGRIHLLQRHPGPAREHLGSALEIHQRHRDPSAAAVDRSWLLEVALLEEEGGEIRRLCLELDAEADALRASERREQLAFRLFRGFCWLKEHGFFENDPEPYLRRAYDELLRKARHLTPEQRHRFLFQIAENAAILDRAAERRYSLPA